eukprot:PhM_4_TR16883/c0_g1_i1/m.66058
MTFATITATVFTAATASVAMAAAGFLHHRHRLRLQRPNRLRHLRGCVIGHRGCCGVSGVRENTLEAFRYAVRNGCDGVELDVRMSSDGVLVVNHDPTINGSDISVTTFSHLKTVAPHLITLQEALRWFCSDDETESRHKLLVEIKEKKHLLKCSTAVSNAILEMSASHPSGALTDRVAVIFFDPRVPQHIDATIPTLVLLCPPPIVLREALLNVPASSRFPPLWFIEHVVDYALSWVIGMKVVPALALDHLGGVGPRLGAASLQTLRSHGRRWNLITYLWPATVCGHDSPEAQQELISIARASKRDDAFGDFFVCIDDAKMLSLSRC